MSTMYPAYDIINVIITKNLYVFSIPFEQHIDILHKQVKEKILQVENTLYEYVHDYYIQIYIKQHALNVWFSFDSLLPKPSWYTDEHRKLVSINLDETIQKLTNNVYYYYNEEIKRLEIINNFSYDSHNDLPTLVYDNGDQFWYKNNKLHRDKKPAIIYATGKQKWYINDKEIFESDSKKHYLVRTGTGNTT